MLFIGIPWTVRCLVVAHHEERTLPITMLQPFQREIGDDVGGIAFMRRSPVRFNHHRIVIEPLSGQHVPVVKTRRISVSTVSEVPFTYHRGLIAICL